VELHTVEVGVAADLTILVSRNADGDLHSGAVAVLRRVDGVADVRNLRVTCIRPRLNDLAVEAEADLAFDREAIGDDPEASAHDALADGFGVTVGTLSIDR
jgi:hypothetical protein